MKQKIHDPQTKKSERIAHSKMSPHASPEICMLYVIN
jgi:hypothetical protein